MNVGLMGFGKAGRAVAAVLLESKRTNLRWVIRQSTVLQHRSVPEFLGVSSDEPGLIYSKQEYEIGTLLDEHPVDVIVDFSSESGLDYYGAEAARRGITVVSAVSHYPDEQLANLRSMAERTKVMHSPNITLGINFVIIASRILRNIAPDVDVEILEEHFRAKAGVSGTAKVIAHELGLPDNSIKTIRAGGIVGVHEVLFGFPNQTVRLKHESISREAFGTGALFAIENLEDKPNGLYAMEDLLIPYFRLRESEAEILEAKRIPWWRVWGR